jgi:hypothetical protein
MKLNKFFLLLAVSLFLVSSPAHASRIPSAKSAKSMTESFFNKYSHKYKNSVLGKNPVTKVEVNSARELSLNNAVIEAYLNLKNGDVVRVLVTAKRTPYLGWSIKSWEMVDQRY